MNKNTGQHFKAVMLGTLILSSTAHAEGISEQDLNYVGTYRSLALFQKFEGPFWEERLTTASEGKIKTQVTTFAEMGLGGSEVFKLLSKGLFDVGSTVAGYSVEEAPELEGLDMPMIAPEVDLAKKVSDAYRPVMVEAMAKRFNGAKLLAVVPYGPQMVFCNTAIDNLDDLKDKKIRASGRTTGEFLEALGAEAITLSFNEVPGALQRGVIDCAVTAPLSGYNGGWYEVSTHLYPLAVGGWDHVVTAMNGKKWASLSKDTQQWLEKQTADYEKSVWDAAQADFEEGINCLTGAGACQRGKAASMTLVKTSEADVSYAAGKLEETVIPAWANRVDDASIQKWNSTIGSVTGLMAKKASN
ncbi:TRAP transporter substrate-binding protein [Marinobacterium arenosum]|uniref:TRAP transporter substrate-binding protein n=1 Tax=Marinobacterium arenosum TaxID=2862496 RepID=UPI001C98AF89|nr:TRAP transporter substrate-binding protein [Marinobacterium arenosum]MBY4678783.1 TRAP transporter substrate-binding protein [Marinobacterium arenosum]